MPLWYKNTCKKSKSPHNLRRFFMLKTQFTLISKSLLTHDVYELVYSCTDMTKEAPKPGQYVMFQLAPGLNRAYSIASFSVPTILPSYHPTIQPSFTLIIKRISDGRGSPMICDAEVGTLFTGLISLGHFVLQDTSTNKCFIGTGTGFAPIYCQALGHSLRAEKAEKIAFIFGVRNMEDSFYESEILELGKSFREFEYVQYFSREETMSSRQQKGYVTDWITPEHIEQYEEFYLCGSPAMVKSAREKLEALGIAKEDIFWEQF
jgi:Na+-transporting NADH:ubiquinone oxidoreductase subunit F